MMALILTLKIKVLEEDSILHYPEIYLEYLVMLRMNQSVKGIFMFMVWVVERKVTGMMIKVL